MAIFRRLPGVRKVYDKTQAIESTLATIESRTNEFGPGVVNTLLYDSAASLEALDHVVSTLHSQEQQVAGLPEQVGSLLHTELAGFAEQTARAGSASLAAVQNLVFEVRNLSQCVVVQSAAPAPPVPSESSDRAELVLQQISRRLDRLALDGDAQTQRGLDGQTEILNRSASIEVLVAQLLDRAGSESSELLDRVDAYQANILQRLESNLESLSGLDAILREIPADLQSLLRGTFAEDLDLGIDLLVKELTRIEELVVDSTRERSASGLNELLQMEQRLRGEMGSDLQRAEDRVLRDIDHTRSVLGAELLARASTVSSEITRSELSLRDIVSAQGVRETDRIFEGLRQSDSVIRSIAEGVDALRRRSETGATDLTQFIRLAHTTLQSLHELQARMAIPSTDPSPVTFDIGQLAEPIERHFSEQRTELKSAIALLEAVHSAAQPGPARPLSDPIQPELELSVALAPYLRNDYVFDVGAHRGTWSTALGRQGLTVAAIEPNQQMIRELTLRTGDLPLVTILHAAAAATSSDTANLYIASDVSPGKLYGDVSLFSTLRQPSDIDGLTFSVGEVVRTVTLAQVVDDLGWPTNVGLIKLDTEGNEYEVLKGLGTIRANVFVIEFWGREYLLNGSAPIRPTADVLEFMTSRGYRRWIAFVNHNGKLRAAVNQRSFPDDCWGNIFFFDDVDNFVVAETWCDKNLMSGCRAASL